MGWALLSSDHILLIASYQLAKKLVISCIVLRYLLFLVFFNAI